MCAACDLGFDVYFGDYYTRRYDQILVTVGGIWLQCIQNVAIELSLVSALQ